MRRIPELQTKRQGAHLGAVCAIALTRKPMGPGRWQLDRVTATLGTAPRCISGVESGLPVTLFKGWGFYDGDRHWMTYLLNRDVRARELWDWWVAKGRPTFRTLAQLRAVVEPFAVGPF